MKAQFCLCACVLCALNEPMAFSAPSQICRAGLCEVFSVSSLGRAGGTSGAGDAGGTSGAGDAGGTSGAGDAGGAGAQAGSNGNISIADLDDQQAIVQLNCRVSAEVPDAAWAGVRAMFESVRGFTGADSGAADAGVPPILSGAQQVMILLHTSIQEMAKEFNCNSAAALWR